jgi:K+-sensing histidine kinase KdpD
MTSDQLSGALSPHPLHPDWPYRRSWLHRYGLALIAVVVAVASRQLMHSDNSYGLVFAFFVPAAMVSVWYGGLGPGLCATVVGLLVGDYFFLPPVFSLWPLGGGDLMGLTVYAVTTAVCVVLCENLHHHVRRYERMLERERHHPLASAAPPGDQLMPIRPAHRVWPFHRTALMRYGVAVVVVAAAFALRYWMFEPSSHRFPFIIFVPAAIVATWYGGIMPGLLATAAGLMLGDSFFLSEHEPLGPVREGERMLTGLYAITTTLCVMLFESLHNRVRRLQHALDHARHHRRQHSNVGTVSTASP